MHVHVHVHVHMCMCMLHVHVCMHVHVHVHVHVHMLNKTVYGAYGTTDNLDPVFGVLSGGRWLPSPTVVVYAANLFSVHSAHTKKLATRDHAYEYTP